MSEEETTAMRRLDSRLAELFSGLDTSPGFEERLLARVAALPGRQQARQSAELRPRLERQYRLARAAADRAARIDELVIAAGGVGAALATWRLGPGLAHWYAGVVAQVDPVTFSFSVLALLAAASWALLSSFDVDPVSFIRG